MAYLEAANDPALVLDLTGTIRWANAATTAVLGWAPGELVGRSAFELVPPADAVRAMHGLQAFHAGHAPPSTAPFSVAAADGNAVECDVSAWLIATGGPRPKADDEQAGDQRADHAVAPAEVDAIAMHLRPTQDARVLRRVLVRLLAGDGSVEVIGESLGLLYHRSHDIGVLVTFVDEQGEDRIVGHELDPVLGGVAAGRESPWGIAAATGSEQLVEDLEPFDDEVRHAARDAGLRGCLITPVVEDGRALATITVWVTDDGPPMRTETYSIPLLRQLIELVLRWRGQVRELELAAHRDALTGLPNRRALTSLDEDGGDGDGTPDGEGGHRHAAGQLGVLYLDLDGFKPVNDRLGHAAGDAVLRAVAHRLTTLVRQEDTVVRLGGDEFGIICPGVSRPVLDEIGRRILTRMPEPITVGADQVVVGASLGAVIGHGRPSDLIRRADAAMYEVKAAGRGALRWADEEHRDGSDEGIRSAP